MRRRLRHHAGMRIRLPVALILAASPLPRAATAQTDAPSSAPPAAEAFPSREDRAAAAGWGKGTWLDQHGQCCAMARQGGVDLVLLGDSITQSWGGPGRSVAAAAAGLLERHFAGLRTANMGISGDRTQNVLWRIRNGTVDGLQPRFVALMVGTNNLSRGEAPADVAHGILTIVTELRRKLPHADILVQPPLPRGPSAHDPMRRATEELRPLLAKAEWPANVALVDLHATFVDADGTLSRGLYADDALHLRPAGYEAWGKALRSAIDRRELRRMRHVVFVAGDEEYRSEESMPMLAALCERTLGVRTTVCLPRDASGAVDPQRLDHIDGLRSLDSADLMVMFTRFRRLPDAELRPIIEHARLGRPMVGFRTATHAFRYPDDAAQAAMNDDWPREWFGQRWIAHHGHFDDGAAPLTAVTLADAAARHPILRGMAPFAAWSWLYHVDGGGDALTSPCTVLLHGQPLRSGLEDARRFPRRQPTAWVRELPHASGAQRVFFTTLGHPYDFCEEPMRRLAVQGIAWALGLQIDPEGLPPEALKAADYRPTNSGIGRHRKEAR